MIPGKRVTEKTVYFVRHGQSLANVTPIFQAEDSPLSEEGKKQAGLIAGRVSKIAFDALISSPYPRTKETAEAISRATGKPIEYSDLFIERRKPTSVTGKPHSDEAARNRFGEWEESLYAPGVRVEDGENLDDIMARTDDAIAFLTRRTERTLVVVTHGFFLRAIAARVLLGDTLTPDNFKSFILNTMIDNTGISAIRYVRWEADPTWRLWIFNDHAHLAE